MKEDNIYVNISRVGKRQDVLTRALIFRLYEMEIQILNPIIKEINLIKEIFIYYKFQTFQILRICPFLT